MPLGWRGPDLRFHLAICLLITLAMDAAARGLNPEHARALQGPFGCMRRQIGMQMNSHMPTRAQSGARRTCTARPFKL